jgi:hypothetical protein
MNNAMQRNIGAFLLAGDGQVVAVAEAVAAGAGDNTKVTGQSNDRQGKWSGKLVISYKTTLAATKTLSFAIEHQDSADNSSWDTAVVDLAATVEKTGALTDDYGTVVLDVNLSGRKRYTRYNITPDLSNTATDTVDWAAVLVLGGADVVPAA